MTTSVGRRYGTLAALTLGVVLLSAPVAGASCAPPLPIEEAMAQAPVVFVATVVNLEHDGVLASFSVDEVWKGDVDARVVVSGGPSPSDLQGLGFGEAVVTSVDRYYEKGVTYLVVPFGVEDGVYMDNGCSATQAYDPVLGEFRPATAHPPVDAGIESEIVIARIAVGAVVLVAAGAVVTSVMRRRGMRPLEGAGSPSGQ